MICDSSLGLGQETRTQVRALPLASSGHVTTQSMSPQRLRSPMLTFATKELLTGANKQKDISKVGTCIFCIFFAYFGIYMQLR